MQDLPFRFSNREFSNRLSKLRKVARVLSSVAKDGDEEQTTPSRFVQCFGLTQKRNGRLTEKEAGAPALDCVAGDSTKTQGTDPKLTSN